MIRKWMIGVTIFAAVIAHGQTSPAKLVRAEKIVEQFNEADGRAKVIVKLREALPAPQGRDWDDAGKLKNFHSANRTQQERVLRALPAAEHTLRRRFDNFAGFSCEVTPQGLEKLQRHPLVESIEPVVMMKPHTTQGLPLMNAMATRGTYSGNGVSIAIVDTGVDYTHPSLGGGGFPNSKVIGGYDFGENDSNPMPGLDAHGTACAGLAAGNLTAVGNDYIGGVAPSARIYALKVTPDAGGSAPNDNIIAAWDWCVTHKNDNPANPILVISTSFGGGVGYDVICDYALPSISSAANNAVAAGITVFASSGNDGFCEYLTSPACISNVIAVGAVYDATLGPRSTCVAGLSCVSGISTSACEVGEKWGTDPSPAADRVTVYSNSGNQLALLAPSEAATTTDIVGPGGYSTNDFTGTFNGTSAACPYAAGAAVALQEAALALRGLYLTPAQIRQQLTTWGKPIVDWRGGYTRPRVDLAKSIYALTSTPEIVAAGTELIFENCLPINNSLDPGEQVSVRFTLANVGTLFNTTNLVATLLNVGGVTGASAPQTYGAIVGPTGSVTRTFTFTINNVPCASVITSVLALVDGSTTYPSVTNLLKVGHYGGQPISQSFNNATFQFLDELTNDIPVTVTTTGVVSALKVRLRQIPSTVSYRDIYLVHPDGTRVGLALNVSYGIGSSIGTGAVDCTGAPVVFDDASPHPFTSANGVYVGDYFPAENLTTLSGKPTQGTWILRVINRGIYSASANSRCFGLDLESFTEIVCCQMGSDVTITKSATAAVNIGSNLAYTLVVTNLGNAIANGVVITDTLPAGTTFQSAPGCTHNAGQVTCLLGNLPERTAATRTITVTPTTPGNLINTAVVTTVTAEVVTNNQLATAATLILTPDLTLLKIADQATPPIFGNLTYDLTVTNLGDGLASSVTITDTLPANVNFVSASPGCTYAAGKVTCPLGTLLAGTSTGATITVTPTFPGNLVNSARVATATFEPVTANNSASNTVFVLDGDVALAKNVTPTITSVTSNLVYSLAVSNTGNTAATTVVVTDTLPVKVAFVTASPNCTHTNGTVTCTFGTLAPGATSNATITVVGLFSGVIVNTGIVTTATAEFLTFNNLATVAASLLDLPPGISAQPAATNICPGLTARFTVTGTGTGLNYQWQRNGVNVFNGSTYSGATSNIFTIAPVNPSDAGNFRCLVSNSGGTVTSSNAALTVKSATGINIQPLPTNICVGATAQFTADGYGENPITYQWLKNGVPLVNGGHFSGVTTPTLSISNSISSDSGAYRCILSASCGTETSIVAQLNVNDDILTVTPAAGNLGGIIIENTSTSFTFYVQNTGCSSLAGEATVPLPFNIVGGSPFSIAPGGTSEIVVNFTPDAVSDYTATITLHDGGNELGSMTIAGAGYPKEYTDLAISKFDLTPPTTVGFSCEWSIIVSNAGISTAASVTLTNPLPEGITDVLAHPSQGSCYEDSGNLICDLGEIQTEKKVAITVIGTATLSGNLTNTVLVTSEMYDPILSNNTATVVINVPFDYDNDGIADAWEYQYGLNPINAADAALDTDGDGHTSLQEYLAGTNPSNSRSVLRITRIIPYTVIWNSVAGKTYRVLYADHPGGPWQSNLPASLLNAGAGETNKSYTDPTATPLTNRFYKIQLIVP